MRVLRAAALALTMALAICALAATSAMAALVKFSETGTFEGKAGTYDLEVSNGQTVVCESVTMKGEVTSEIEAHALVLFAKCTSKITIVTSTCTSSGATSGSIEIPNLGITLGSDSGTEDLPAVFLQAKNATTGEPEAVKFSCSALGQEAKLTVTGSSVCLAKNQSGVKNSVLVECEKGAKSGEQRDKFFWAPGIEDKEAKLLTTSTGAVEFTNLETNMAGESLLKGVSSEIEILLKAREYTGEGGGNIKQGSSLTSVANAATFKLNAGAAGGPVITCKEVESIWIEQNPSKEFSISPEYRDCVTGGGEEAKFDMKNCVLYRLKEPQAAGLKKWTAAMDVTPNGCSMEIELGKPVECVITVKGGGAANQGLATVEEETEAGPPAVLKLKFKVAGVAYTTDNKPICVKEKINANSTLVYETVQLKLKGIAIK